MRTRARACAWIAAFGLVVPSGVAAQDRTEREVVELIVRDGPQARAIRAATDVTRLEQLARLAYPNPGVSYSREGIGFTEFLQVEQALPLFGVRAALSNAGGAATAAAEADRDARLWILRSQAASAVARLVAEQAGLAAVEAHGAEVERLVGVLRTREREGEGSRFDRVRAEEELRDVRQSIADGSAAAAEAGSTVAGLLPAGTALGRILPDLDQPPAAPQLAALLARATTTRAELRTLQRAGDRASFEAAAARRGRLPAATLFGGLKRAGEGGDRERGAVFGLDLSIPLFDRGGRDAARWAAEGARVAAEHDAAEQQVRAEIAGRSSVLALRQQTFFDDQSPGGEELLQIAEIAYREGEVGILELLDAVRTSTRARVRRAEILFELRQAQIALERAVGEVLWP